MQKTSISSAPNNSGDEAEGRSSTPRTGFRRLSTLLAPLAGVLSNPSEFGLFHAPQTQWRRGRYFVPDII